MRKDGDGMLLVRADLCDRLDMLQQRARTMNVRDLVRDIQAIQMIASAYGLAPLASLARSFERALSAQPRLCPAGLYLERLRDAIGCTRDDAAAGESLMASVAVRLQA